MQDNGGASRHAMHEMSITAETAKIQIE